VRQGGKLIAGPARKTKPEAREALRLKLAALDERSDANRHSLSSWARSHSDRPELSPTTRTTYASWARSIAADPIGAMQVTKISDADLRQWYQRMPGAATTKRKRLAWVRSLLSLAGVEVRFAPKAPRQTVRRPLSPEEVHRLREALINATDRDRLCVLLALELGLRRGEACGLMHEDREDDGVRLRRSVVRASGALVVRARLKTAASAAWLPLPPSLLSLIGPPKKGFVLGDGRVPMAPSTFSDAVGRIFAAASLRVPYGGPHALRRTFGMTLIESGVDVVTAAELMRHDPTMLLREYTESRVDLKRAAMKKAFQSDMISDTDATA
jgi:integrase